MRCMYRVLYPALVVMGLAAAGCTGSGQTVPSGALEVSSGNREVSYTAPQDGKIYLRDDFDKRTAYSAEVRKNQVVRFDPKQNAVLIDGAVAAQQIPGAWHQHTLFFEPSAQTAASNNPDVIKVPVKVQVTQPSEGQ